MNSKTHPQADVRLPKELEQQLYGFRNSMWRTKSIDAIAILLSAVLWAFLVVFGLDRVVDTPSAVRLAALALAGIGGAAIPLCLYRWIWRRRNLPQVARLVGRQMPDAGDRLLGVLELVDNRSEQRRSPALCHAAIQQVAADAKKWSLTETALPPRRKAWRCQAVAGLALMAGLAAAVPAATQNSWARLLAPFGQISRYSFAALADVPQSLVVAHGEPFTLELALAKSSLWKPQTGRIAVGSQQPLEGSLDDQQYRFDVPAQIAASTVVVRIGDARHQIELRPTLRPELTSVVAEVKLPDYLERQEKLEQDVRGGALTLVTGSLARIRASANRELQTAHVDGVETKPQQTHIETSQISVDKSREVRLEWTDALGLEGKQPFRVAITRADDEAPAVSCQGLSRQQVVLNSEQLQFDVQAVDDFGVRRVGIEWNGMTRTGSLSDFQGERVLAAGGAVSTALHAAGTFTATSLGIDPQPIVLRAYAEDYYPDRGRSYSPAFVLYVLSPDQHAIWLTEQLSKWHRRALEVRDRELQLYETNRELRSLPATALEQGDTRRQIQRQAAAERANGRRLTTLSRVGEQLVQQAMRNTEFGVGHLEKWAEMLQLLQDISANRMPSVADLLAAASEAPPRAGNSETGPTAGVNRSPPSSGKGSSDPPEAKPPVPQLADVESTQQPQGQEETDSPPSESASAPSLGLPVTTLMGKASGGEACPVGDKMDNAIDEQRDLLAEFEKIANELNAILANLEGSTLVKRLKAAAREQYTIAGEIGGLIDTTFGFGGGIAGEDRDSLADLSQQEDTSSLAVSYIMDDMQAYFQRRPFARFRTVLDEMNENDVVGNLRELSEDISRDQGISMAQCEFWSDSLDRWAEDLVDPASGGT